MNKNFLYICCVLIFISGLFLFYYAQKQSVKNLKETLTEVYFPSENNVITLGEDGTYSIYHQFAGIRDGKAYNDESINIKDITVGLTNLTTNKPVELLVPESIKRYRYRGTKGIKMFEFINNGTNEYKISSKLLNNPDNKEYVIVIEDGFEEQRVGGILSAQAALIVPTVLALVLFIRVYIKN